MGGLLFKENGGCKGVGEVGDYVTMNGGGGGGGARIRGLGERQARI